MTVAELTLSTTIRERALVQGGSHDQPIVLPHEPVGGASQEFSRDVTTVHWNNFVPTKINTWITKSVKLIRRIGCSG
eukprot:Em0007g847a